MTPLRPTNPDPDDTFGLIEAFLAGHHFAVVGASNNRAKYGNKVLRAYLQAGRSATPVHPTESTVEGLAAVPSLSDLPDPAAIHGVSIITPPPVTERVIQDAIAAGIQRLWLQPGAESDAAIAAARNAGLDIIAHGPCILVALGYREDPSA